LPKARAEAACLALLRAVDAAEADAFSALVVQDFEGVAVEDGDDFTDGRCRIASEWK